MASSAASSSSSSGGDGSGSAGFAFTSSVTLESVRASHRAFSHERDWGRYHTPRNLLLALVGEVGELAEIFQWTGEVQEGAPELTADARANLADELADCLLYLVALSDRCHVDLATAVQEKMKKNAAKYPAGQVRGSSKKYNEYTVPAATAAASSKPSLSRLPTVVEPTVLDQPAQTQQPTAGAAAVARANWPPPPPPMESVSVESVAPASAHAVHLASPPPQSNSQPQPQQSAASASALVSPTSKRVSFASGTAKAVRRIPAGAHYVGATNAAGAPHGHGTLYRADGSIERAGSWKDGTQNGLGRHIRSDGGFYEGEFQNSKKHGLGRFVYADGSVYEGEWSMNAANGYGCKWDAQGSLVTCGRAKSNALAETCPVPLSKLPYGSFVPPQAREAHATLLMPDGGWYAGDLSAPNPETGGDILPHGHGTAYQPSGAVSARGNWEHGVLHGTVEIAVLPGGLQYIGEFERGQRHGQGRCYWTEDGSEYDGAWLHGVQHGVGRQVLPDNGYSYEGEFEADQPHGLGAMWNPEGQLLVCGLWQNADLVETRPIPRRVLPKMHFLSDEARQSLTWLNPDGSFVTGGQTEETHASTTNTASQPYDSAMAEEEEKKSDMESAAVLAAAAAAAPAVAVTSAPPTPLSKKEREQAAKAAKEQQKAAEKAAKAEKKRLEQQAEAEKKRLAQEAEKEKKRIKQEAEEKKQADKKRAKEEAARAKEEAAAAKRNPSTPVKPAAAQEKEEQRAASPAVSDAAAAAAASAAAASVAAAAVSQQEPDVPDVPDAAAASVPSVVQHYVGQTNAQGLPHGEGTLYRPDGSVERSGLWRDGAQHGAGRNLRSDGGRYEGEFAANKKHGLGRFVYPDGSVYEGEWHMGAANGYGVKWDAQGRMTTCGRAKNNALDKSCPVPRSKLPYGSFLPPSASAADLVMPAGGWYIGDVSPATNLPHGIGTHFGASGVEIASGEWNEGALHGDGSATLPTGELYSGSFSHGLRHGHGRCTWPDEQTTYEGMWSEGRMSGIGRQELPDGSAFEGEFSEDQPHGLGAVFSKSGELQACGRWENSDLVEARAIPRSVLPAGSAMFPGPLAQASLLWPDGSYLLGEVDALLRPRPGAVRYTAQGDVHPEQLAEPAAAAAAAADSEASRVRSAVVDINAVKPELAAAGDAQPVAGRV